MGGRNARDEVYRGVRASIRNNGQAYGFSVSITGSFGLLTTTTGTPSGIEIMLFGFGAAAAFTLLEILATKGFRRPLEEESVIVSAFGVSLSFLSVGITLGVAWLIGELLPGPEAWPVAGALASAIYLLLAGVQLAVAESASRARRGRTGG
ncbi:hypothetical protein O7626_08880 [Micromonospora sp. WMMD1102]|uniref:hypothetical protein n=1 Tax=Micromonospora sp. WMMD1102 TaxID=3016105 RepID=UPI00241583D1|nr:hypothetical protein [Micromonospora sp. WMMD1102]MDG4786037.1 hypothetical protein [Micromonospora sp. WMMD1102]